VPKTDSPVKTHLRLPLPQPLFSMPYQNGITDPLWPETYPASFDPGERAQFHKAQVVENRLEQSTLAVPARSKLEKTYLSEYAGRVARQDFQSAIRVDVNAGSRDELEQVLRRISEIVIEETEKKASAGHVRAFDPIPDSYRVTITVSFGASLFVDGTGFDRYGLSAQRPKWLKTMPSFPGDHPTLKPERTASDLMLVVASDHPYVNVAIVRYFAEYFNRDFSAAHHSPGEAYNVLSFRGVEEGFARKDKREFLRFDDGIENLHIDPRDLRRLVYVDPSDNEPAWCRNGSYLVYRKIREMMPVWEALDDDEQGRMIGRDKKTGLPLSHKRAGHDEMTPVFPDPTDEAGVRLNAHIRKVQPRRPSPDLFGLNDLERRFLRRPYPFFDGLDGNGQAINGLHFMAFMKNIQQQFEHVVNMWQMNPDFPVPGTGVDALYAKGILSTIDGGYYFCPPGLKDRNDYFGSGMFVHPVGGA
jgi:deferrochelatase/peroxidase EfeB